MKVTYGERLVKIETEVTNINKAIDKHTVDQRKDFDTVFTKLDDLDEKFDNKFAGKWVEKVNIGLLVAIIGGLIIFFVTK